MTLAGPYDQQRIKLFSTPRTDVYRLTHAFTDALQDYLTRNRENFTPYEPLRDDDFYERVAIADRIAASLREPGAETALLLVFTKSGEDRVIGSVNFSNFVRGVFQACHLGFSIDKAFEGQGLMREVLKPAMRHVHEQCGLHRIMANHLPSNDRSRRTLESLGFEKEGFARAYLKINGRWEDHVLNAFIFDADEGGAA